MLVRPLAQVRHRHLLCGGMQPPELLVENEMSEKANSTDKTQRRQLVKAAAAQLRDIILEREPGANIGSLKEVAQMLGVGIVTVQQAARILEHEGLLAVRRGPGGGYHGTRPDE